MLRVTARRLMQIDGLSRLRGGKISSLTSSLKAFKIPLSGTISLHISCVPLQLQNSEGNITGKTHVLVPLTGK